MWILLWLINFFINLISAKRYPYLQFKLQGENTAISGIEPWLQQHVFDPQECLRICVNLPLKCTYIHVLRSQSDSTQWLCQLYDDIKDLSSYLVSKMNSVLYSAVHENHHCSDMKNQLGYTDDGLYYITFYRKRKQVFCDLTKNGGGWTVIQRRINGSFGSAAGEYWIGNDAIHELTKNTSVIMQVRLEGTSFEDETKYIIYERFYVESEDHKYRLHVGTHVEDPDLLSSGWLFHDTMKFSTPDQDNDGHGSNHCASINKSGWWYKNCLRIHPNGVYYDGVDTDESRGTNIRWTKWSRNALKHFSISIRRK